MKKFFKNKPRAWFIIGAIFIGFLTIAGLATILMLDDNTQEDTSDVLAVVGSEKITTADLNERIYARTFAGTPDNPEEELTQEQKDEILQEIIEQEIIQIKADELGLSTSNEEVQEFINTIFSSEENSISGSDVYENYNDYQKELTKENAHIEILKQKVKDTILAWSEGYYMRVSYNRYSPALLESLEEDMNEDERVIKEKQLKIDAKNTADRLYSDLQSGKDVEEVYNTLALDEKVGYQAIAPDRPSMEGEIVKSHFFDDYGLAGYLINREFADKVFSVEKNKYSEPFTIKDENGDEIKAYFIYIAEDNSDGYKWGYKNWLNNQIKELLSESVIQKVSNSLIQKVYAFSNDHCGTSTVGTDEVDHGFCFMARSYYYGRGTTSQINIPNMNFVLDTGCVAAIVYNGGNYGMDCAGKTSSKLTRGSGSNGRLFFSYNELGTGEDNWHDYINCNKTTRFDIQVGGDPSISGAITSLGYWDDFSTWFENDISTKVLDSWGFDSTSGTAMVRFCLNNASDCSSSSATKWANGKSLAVAFKWTPHWNDAPNIEPTNHSKTIEGATRYDIGDASQRVYLNAKSNDPNSDQVRYKLAYKKSTDNGSSWSGWTYYPNSDGGNDTKNWVGWKNDNVDTTVNSYLPSDLGLGTYKVVYMSEDMHLKDSDPVGSDNAWSHNDPRYFVIEDSNVPGCTDSTADNYNSEANEDDGSCEYSPGCSASPLSGIAPLPVKFSLTGGANKSYELFLGPTIDSIKGSFNSSGSASHWFTYNSPGEYSPYLRSSSKDDDCGNPYVTVTSATDSEGGEVAP